MCTGSLRTVTGENEIGLSACLRVNIMNVKIIALLHLRVSYIFLQTSGLEILY